MNWRPSCISKDSHRAGQALPKPAMSKNWSLSRPKSNSFSSELPQGYRLNTSWRHPLNRAPGRQTPVSLHGVGALLKYCSLAMQLCHPMQMAYVRHAACFAGSILLEPKAWKSDTCRENEGDRQEPSIECKPCNAESTAALNYHFWDSDLSPAQSVASQCWTEGRRLAQDTMTHSLKKWPRLLRLQKSPQFLEGMYWVVPRS